MFSPLKEPHEFNKYVEILRVKMTKKSPEDQQESGRPTRVRKSNKSPEDYQGQEQETWRPKETYKSQEVFKSQRRLPSPKNPEAQESGGLTPSKSQTQEDDSPISPPTRGGDREKEEEKDTPESAPDSYWFSIKGQ